MIEIYNLLWKHHSEHESWTSEWLSRSNDDGDLEELSGSSGFGTPGWFNNEICQLSN